MQKSLTPWNSDVVEQLQKQAAELQISRKRVKKEAEENGPTSMDGG